MKFIFYSTLIFFICSCASIHIEKRRFKKGYFVSIDKKNPFKKAQIDSKNKDDENNISLLENEAKIESHLGSENNLNQPNDSESRLEIQEVEAKNSNTRKEFISYEAIKTIAKKSNSKNNFFKKSVISKNKKDLFEEEEDEEIEFVDYLGVVIGVVVLPIAIAGLIFAYLYSYESISPIKNKNVRLFVVLNAMLAAFLGYGILFRNLFRKFRIKKIGYFSPEYLKFSACVAIGIVLSILIYGFLFAALL